MKKRTAAALAVLMLVLGAADAYAQRNCTRGKPCGNTCIAQHLTCRIGQGSATAAPQTQAPSPALPSGGRWAPIGETEPCIVARVIDGDTIECQGERRVRLLLVDAPEMNQGEYGGLAKVFLESVLPVGAVTVLEFDVERQDRYQRALAYVHLSDGRVANYELVRSGMGIVSVYPPNVRHVDRLRAASDSAKVEKRGLWAGSAFECTPADHRAGRCGG